MTTALLLFGSMALFILIGVPIAFALGAAVWSTIVFSPDFTVTVGIIAQRIFGGLESTSIMAIPFFILAGNLMTKGGISRRLVNFANCIVGNVRGGMALALVLACAFFAALSGSAPATVIAIGSMLYPEMVRMGYPKDRQPACWWYPAAWAPSFRPASSWWSTPRSPAPPLAICSLPACLSAS